MWWNRIKQRREIVGVLVLLLAFACSPSPRYRIGGRTETAQSGAYQVGLSSYYGEEFHGRPTASGEIFDMYALTAAHRELPFGTRIKVTNLDNGKSVIVRINDRGPFVEGRILDLSYGAARRIGMVGKGTARVRIEIIGSGR